MAFEAVDEFAGGTEVPPASRHVEGSDEREATERRKADVMIVSRLASRGFKGPEWEKFAESLAEYGLAVLTAWLANGQIFPRADMIGRGVSPSDEDREVLRTSPDERSELAAETVARAILLFKLNLREGKWDPAQGATLRTYFVGALVQSFPNTFRAWAAERRRVSREYSVDMAEIPDIPTPDNAVQVLDQVEADRLLAGLDGFSRSIVTRIAMGYSHAEIGAELGISGKAVEGRMARLRHRLRYDSPRDDAE